MSKKSGIILALSAIALIIYNIVVFTAAGFAGHNATFWFAYIFIYVAGIAVGAMTMLLQGGKARNRDILFGLPLFKHSIFYVFIQLVVTTIFMIFSEKIINAVAIVVQVILLGIYLFLAATCLMAKEIVVETDNKLKNQVLYTRKIQMKANEAARIAEDAEVKKAFEKLAEKIRYSDPGSNEQTAEIEKELEECLDEAVDCLSYNDAKAIYCCIKAEKLLEKRNEMCRLFKS